MKLLVTGGAGFIGSAVVRLAVARGHQVDRLKADSQPAFDTWLANSDNSKLLAKASAPRMRKSSTRRGRNGWYRASNGNYCRLGGFGLWCQSWKPNAW